MTPPRSQTQRRAHPTAAAARPARSASRPQELPHDGRLAATLPIPFEPPRGVPALARELPDRAGDRRAGDADALPGVDGDHLRGRQDRPAGPRPLQPLDLDRGGCARLRTGGVPGVHRGGRRADQEPVRPPAGAAGRALGRPDADRALGLQRREADHRDGADPELGRLVQAGLPGGVSAPRPVGHRLHLDRDPRRGPRAGGRLQRPRGPGAGEHGLGVPADHAEPDLGLPAVRDARGRGAARHDRRGGRQAGDLGGAGGAAHGRGAGRGPRPTPAQRQAPRRGAAHGRAGATDASPPASRRCASLCSFERIPPCSPPAPGRPARPASPRASR